VSPSTSSGNVDFPYALERVGTVMTPAEGDPLEAEGVLNPASGRGPDGRLYLLPRIVATGNVSRVGLAKVVVTDGVPTGVEREGVVLEPETTWETAEGNAGVEDPRVTWVEALGLHVMTYVAFGPLGPRTAIATSTDLRTWTRLGPVVYRWDAAAPPDSSADLNLFHNKDTVFFPEPVTAPDGTESLAVLHRPMGMLRPFKGDDPVRATPPGPAEERQSIWISFVPLAEAQRDPGALTVWRGHRWLIGPNTAWEQLKIGGGPPPLRVPEGWLLLHHGVTGEIDEQRAQQQRVRYVAGGILLHAEEPWKVIARSSEPLLEPSTEAETTGIVPNVVFPTAVEEIDGEHFVFYGMADSAIGVARLTRRNT
jgi:beta-1,2-mannobiose phosphorylase / 1,2-beta-oligomannan phosphorylase